MAVITSGLYKITLLQSYSAQNVLNTFFYEHTLGLDDDQDLCGLAFDEDILALLAAIQHTSLTYTEIRTNNVTGDLADTLTTPSQANGDLVGDPLNTFSSVGIRLDRTTKETRNGQKRFAGLTEDVVVNQGFTSGYLVDVAILGVALSGDIDTPGAIFAPVIARQDPITPANWTTNPVQTATINTFVTHQVSRARKNTF